MFSVDLFDSFSPWLLVLLSLLFAVQSLHNTCFASLTLIYEYLFAGVVFFGSIQ